MPMVTEVSPTDLKAQLDAGERVHVIDVREAWELDIARLPFPVHLPMNQVPERLQELPRDVPITVMCRSGGRSLQVARFLEKQGFDRVANLSGGILAWREQIDPTLSPY